MSSLSKNKTTKVVKAWMNRASFKKPIIYFAKHTVYLRKSKAVHEVHEDEIIPVSLHYKISLDKSKKK